MLHFIYKFLLVNFFIFLFICGSFAENNSSKIITSIEIKGLKKTDQKVVLNALSIKKGDSINNFNEKEVKQSLNKLGLFSKINISLENTLEGLKITLLLKEKMTKLLVPIAKSGTSGSAIGLVFLDTNFLGKKDTLVTVLMKGNKSQQYTLIYGSDSIFETNFVNESVFSFEDSSYINKSILDNKTNKYEYSQKLFMGSSAFGYKFGSITFLLSSMYKKLSIFDISLNEKNDDLLNYSQKGETYSFGPKLYIDKMIHEDFLFYGFDLKTSIFRNISNINETNKLYSHEFQLETSYSFLLFSKSKILLGFDTLLSNLPFFEQKRASNGRGMRSILGDNISYQNLIAGTISNEYLFYYNNTFGLSNVIFAERGVINGEFNKSYINYTGIGAGLNVYFKKVAIPALGLYFTNNFKTNKPQFIFVLGMPI